MKNIRSSMMATLVAALTLFLGFATPSFGAGGTTTIAGLPSASSLDGTELVPIWQSSATKNVDVAHLRAIYGAPVPPVSPYLYQLWINSTASPYPVEQWDGTQWVVLGSLDTNAHTWTPKIGGNTPAAIATSGSASDLATGTVPVARLPLPAVSTVGAVKSHAAVSHQFLTSINTDGSSTAAQPAAGDVSGLAASATTDTTQAGNISSGTLPAGRLPATGGGDVSCASGGGNCAIAANTVTNAQAAQMAANTVKCNPTGSTANAQDCVAPTVSGTVTAGAFTSTGLVDISASTAGQIKFPATQNPSSDANTLDDYREGSYTPTLTPATSGSITLGGATSARYIKIGRQVTVWYRCATTAISSPVGAISMSLPFQSDATINILYDEPVAIFSNVTLSAGYTVLGQQITPSATTTTLVMSGSASVASNPVAQSAWASNSEIRGTLSYYAVN